MGKDSQSLFLHLHTAGAKDLRSQLGLPTGNSEKKEQDGQNKEDIAEKKKQTNDEEKDDDGRYNSSMCSPGISELLRRMPAVQKAMHGDEVPSEQEIDEIVRTFVAERVAEDPAANAYMLPDSAHMRLHLPAFMDQSLIACEQRIDTVRAWLEALDDDALPAREQMRAVLQQPQFLKVLLELCRHPQAGVAPLAAEVMGRLCAWYCEYHVHGMCVCMFVRAYVMAGFVRICLCMYVRAHFMADFVCGIVNTVYVSMYVSMYPCMVYMAYVDCAWNKCPTFVFRCVFVHLHVRMYDACVFGFYIHI